jgi:hypothetical protein
MPQDLAEVTNFFKTQCSRICTHKTNINLHICKEISADGHQLKLAQILGIKLGHMNVKFSELEIARARVSVHNHRHMYLPTYHSALQPWVDLGLLYNQSPQPMRPAIGMDPRMMTRGCLLGFRTT